MNLDDAYTEFLTNQVAPPPAPPVPEPVAAPEPAPMAAPAPAPAPGEFTSDMSISDYLGTVFRTLADIPDAAVRGAAQGLGEAAYAANLIDENQINSYRKFFTDMDKLRDVSGVNPTVSGMVEDVGQILPGALPAFKALRALPFMTRPVAAILAEGIGGAVGYNPDDPNLGNMISGMIGEDSQGPLAQAMQMLATNPEDPDIVNRARNFAQDAGLGGMFEGVFKAIQKSPDAGRAALQWFTDTARSAQQGTAFSGIPTRPDVGLPQFMTSDGYRFYQQKDGTLTDHPNPEMSDMTFDSLQSMADDLGRMPLPVGKNEIAEKKGGEAFIREFASFMDDTPGNLPEDVKQQRALNVQSRRGSMQPVVQPNDLTASLYVEQPIPGFADSIEQTRRLPSEELTAQRQNGLLPFLHVKTTVADPIGGFVKTIKPGNAQRAFSALDTAAQRHPNPAASPETWVAYQADLMGKKPNTETAVSLPPYQLIRYKNDPQTLTNVMRNLTDEQAGMAKQGLDAAEEIGSAYASGVMTPQDTAELLLWGMLSRQKSAYPHEAAFIDLVSHTDANGMTLRSFVDKVVDGSFSKADTESYLKWAKEVMPVGTPGRAAVDNMNAYGKNMLPTLTKEVDGKTVLNHIHEMISDPNKSGREIRREFFRLAEGSGIDNKVLSFVLLLTGRKDVMVLDRIQFNHMWNDGRFGYYNLYTPVSQMNPDGSPVLTPKGKPAMMTGSTISDIGKNAYGLMIYEAMERELETILPQVYNSLGRDFRGLGQFHWESWVLTSQQEAAHPSVASFVNRAQEGTNLPPSSMEAGVFSREGRFDAIAYGAEYGQKADGSRVIRYPNSEGKLFEFTPDQFQKFTKDIVKPSKGVVYKGFKPTDFSEGTIPWVNDERINRQALDELIRQSGAVAN